MQPENTPQQPNPASSNGVQQGNQAPSPAMPPVPQPQPAPPYNGEPDNNQTEVMTFPSLFSGIKKRYIIFAILLSCNVLFFALGNVIKDPSWKPIQAKILSDHISDCYKDYKTGIVNCSGLATVKTEPQGRVIKVEGGTVGNSNVINPIGDMQTFWISGNNYSDVRTGQPAAGLLIFGLIITIIPNVFMFPYVLFSLVRHPTLYNRKLG